MALSDYSDDQKEQFRKGFEDAMRFRKTEPPGC
jgi:hypothetical protein